MVKLCKTKRKCFVILLMFFVYDIILSTGGESIEDKTFEL